MSQTLLAPAAGRDFLAAQDLAAGSGLARALRAYFLMSGDARRFLRAGRLGAAGLCAVELESLAVQAANAERRGEPEFGPLAARCFSAADALVAAMDTASLTRDSPSVDVRPPPRTFASRILALVAALNDGYEAEPDLP